MPRVSILLPCYNAAATLPTAIASLEAQTFRDFEVIAIDDGSDDHTIALLDSWRRRDARVHLHARAHQGIVAALVHGEHAANGEIIARMDADDVAHDTRLERQLDLLDRDPQLAACGTGVRYFPREIVRAGARAYEQWLNAVHTSDDMVREIFVECPLAHPTLCVRRAQLERVGGYQDHGWPEDYDLVLRLFEAGAGMANVPEVLLDWREQPQRLSRTDPRYDAAAFRRCKVFYLRRTLLRQRQGVVVWGAGPVGKAFARELRVQGERLRAFVDVDPRKVGQVIHGTPVIGADALAGYPGALTIAAVGSAGAREEIRGALRQAGLVEGLDFIAAA